MSTIEETTVVEERPRQVIERQFQATALEVEGRTVDVRVVPFAEVARVADPPDFKSYEEQWMPGCFDHQLNAANRIHANVNHSRHVIDVVGHGIALRSEQDGYHASFEIHETQAGETALALLRGGALPAVSLEARPRQNVRTAGGIVQRVKSDLLGVAFCREGAFKGAQVLAIREDATEDITLDEALLPVDMDPETVERCRRLGIALPQRYQAHPANTDTPPDGGTSEAAPVSPVNTENDSEES